MKEYTKPVIEYIEIRPEERLACSCNCGNQSMSLLLNSFFNFLGWVFGQYCGSRSKSYQYSYQSKYKCKPGNPS
jgi:hypothetical protein